MTAASSRADEYDAVIVGASFAGLAAALQLQEAGRVLLVDRQPVGAGETSACGTLLAVLERLDALDALEQIHPVVAVNTAGRRIVFRPGYPFATFDYRTLCGILAARLDRVEVTVTGFGGVDDDGALVLGRRRVRGRVLIDASGWRALLARQYGAPPPDPTHRSVGVELRHPHRGRDLEFWVRPPERPDGVFWAFPARTHTREGVGSYTGRSGRLRSDLARFLGEATLPLRAVHGGVFPSRLRDPVAGPVFVVGDAAGQCLPLSGEGIRPALVWGHEAGRHAARVLRGEVGLDTALASYRSEVLAHRWAYRTLGWLQASLLHTPRRVLPTAVSLFTQGPLARTAQRAYWEAADPYILAAAAWVTAETGEVASHRPPGIVSNTPTFPAAACWSTDRRHHVDVEASLVSVPPAGSAS